MFSGAKNIGNIQSSGSQSHRGYRAGSDDLLLRVVDGGLAAVIFVVPLFLGGRYAVGQFVLVLLAVIVAIAWYLRQSIRGDGRSVRSFAGVLIAAGIVLVLLQLAPLGWSTAQRNELLPLWAVGEDVPGKLGQWSQITLTPDATRGGLAMLLAYAMLFLVARQRLRRVEDVQRLLRWIAWSAIAMASLGLVQYLTSNGKFLWIYEHPWRTTDDAVKGSFGNKNHFAHYLALGIGPLIWWTQRSFDSRQSRTGGRFSQTVGTSGRIRLYAGLCVVAIGIVLFAGLMTLSRGGAAMLLLGTVICLVLFYRASLLSGKFVLGFLGIFVLVGTALFIHGYERVSNRLDDYTAGSIEELDHQRGRRKIWEANLAAISNSGLLGSGIGSHREVYPIFIKESPSTEYTHAENGYLQVALEAGLPGLMLLLAGIGLCASWCFRGLRMAARSSRGRQILACLGAVSASLAVSVVHSAVDFVWYIPACMAVTVLLAACALRLYQLSFERTGKKIEPVNVSSSVCLVTTTVVLLVGLWMLGNRFGPAMASPHWDSYLRKDMAIKKFRAEQSRRAARELLSQKKQIGQTAAQDGRAKVSAREDMDSVSAAGVRSMISDLEKVLRWNPDDARAHLRMAATCMLRFQFVLAGSDSNPNLSSLSEETLKSWDFTRMGKQTVARFDANADRVLSDAELEAPAQLRQRASEADRNQNGKLTESEIDRWLRGQLRSLAIRFDAKSKEIVEKYDVDRDGTITVAQARQESDLDAPLDNADYNADSRLTAEEIRRAMVAQYNYLYRYIYKGMLTGRLIEADRNFDSRLTDSEISVWMRNRWLSSHLMFTVKSVEILRQVDTDGDKSLTRAELDADTDLKSKLSNADRDRDGRLTFEEIAQAYREKYKDEYKCLYKALHHARLGLKKCPLQGEGYLYLAGLCFLMDLQDTSKVVLAKTKAAYVDQAVRVRPFDGDVLLVAGKEAALAGHDELALELWRRSLKSGPEHRIRFITMVASQRPADFFIRNFKEELDSMACSVLVKQYQSLGMPDQMIKVLRFYANVAEAEANEPGLKENQAAGRWLTALRVHQKLGNEEGKLHCARQAAKCNPDDFQVRYQLAMCLVQQELLEEAEPHLGWCLRRKPDHPALQNAMKKVVKERLRGQREAVSRKPKQDAQRR